MVNKHKVVFLKIKMHIEVCNKRSDTSNWITQQAKSYIFSFLIATRFLLGLTEYN